MQKPRRRLQAKGKVPTRPSFAKIVRDVAPLASKAYGAYKSYKNAGQRKRNAYKAVSVQSADNVSTLPITMIGVPRKLSFAEKVARVERPPILFKRNYQFNAECGAGRKAWFNIGFNHYNTDLNQDLTTYQPNLTSDTGTGDDTLSSNAVYDQARFYIDYMSSKLQFMNSGSNSITGKLYLYAYNRDCPSTYASAIPINPVNLMMYYSTNSRALVPSNNEATVGNGWAFNSSTANADVDANYNMPGSSVNTTGVCAFTDLALSPSSIHIKRSMDFWFKKVAIQSFSLKPGQQLNKIIKFHDLIEMRRELLDYQFFKGISYALAVEFQGQVVGSDDLVAGIGVVSTGSAQLSVIREDIRILGQKNGLKSKILLQTSPLSQIPAGNQVIINPDTGVQLDAYVEDA